MDGLLSVLENFSFLRNVNYRTLIPFKVMAPYLGLCTRSLWMITFTFYFDLSVFPACYRVTCRRSIRRSSPVTPSLATPVTLSTLSTGKALGGSPEQNHYLCTFDFPKAPSHNNGSIAQTSPANETQ